MTTQATVRAAPEKLADAELVDHIRAGDMRALEVLMRRHNRALYRTARAILRDDAEAEDAVQEAYIQAYRSLGSWRGEAKVSTWLVRIAANAALVRRRRRVAAAEVIPMDETIPAQEMNDDHLLRRLLEKRIDALPDGYRAVFVLRALEELSVEETAAALDIPEATVRTRFFRARAMLRATLASDLDVGMEGTFGFAGERCDRIVAKVLERIAAGT